MTFSLSSRHYYPYSGCDISRLGRKAKPRVASVEYDELSLEHDIAKNGHAQSRIALDTSETGCKEL